MTFDTTIVFQIGAIIAFILPWIYVDHKLARQAVGTGRKLIRDLLALLPPLIAAVLAAHILSVYKINVDFSEPQKPIRMVYDDQNSLSITGLPFNGNLSNAIPSNGIPSNSIPSNGIPSNGIPSNDTSAIPAEAIPSNALPAEAIPSNSIPSNSIPSNVIVKNFSKGPSNPPPSFPEKVCSSQSSKKCDENTSYTYWSNDPGEELAGPPDQFWGSISVQFYAEEYALTRGECTNIHWDATGANKVSINETPSNISGAKQICPNASQTYVIVATSADGAQVSSSLSIQVQEPVVESNSGQELAGPDRCSVFNGINISPVQLQWQKGSPLSMYFKIPGGVPGLGKEIAGDTNAWKYSVTIGSYNSQNCDVIDKNYPDRLFCTVNIPEEYSLALVSMSLSVNDCSSPIYNQQKVGLIEMTFPTTTSGGGGNKGGGKDSGGGGGQESGCPAGQSYHGPTANWGGGCCSDGHWYTWPGDSEPGCWEAPGS